MTEGRLEVRRGGTHISIRAAEIDELCRAVFDGVVSGANPGGGRVKIEYPRFSVAGLVRHSSDRAEIE